MSASSQLAVRLADFDQSHAPAINLCMKNINVVATTLDLLKPGVPVITVAGTNGKGSTLAMLSEIYSAAGYSVGCYTSPHLLTANERIKINQQMVADHDLYDALSQLDAARQDISLTYFESMTLAALLLFKAAKVQVILLEVGMGGRLDATNIIDANVAVITTIALDHQEYLGDTIEAIGREKAGILRRNQAFIYADEAVPVSILEQASALDLNMLAFKQDYQVNVTPDKLGILFSPLVDWQWFTRPNLHIQAAAAAVMASKQLLDRLPVSPEHWEQAMCSVQVDARQQLVQGTVSVLYDVAHNPQAVEYLAGWFQHNHIAGRVHAVFSALQDKDLAGLITPMRMLVDAWYPACLSGPRASSQQQLLEAFKVNNIIPKDCFMDPAAAYYAAKQRAVPGDLILVYGSFLTVSAVMTECNKNEVQT